MPYLFLLIAALAPHHNPELLCFDDALFAIASVSELLLKRLDCPL